MAGYYHEYFVICPQLRMHLTRSIFYKLFIEFLIYDLCTLFYLFSPENYLQHLVLVNDLNVCLYVCMSVCFIRPTLIKHTEIYIIE